MLCLLLAMAASTAVAAPVGYSVNSDAPDGDALHSIDLATGIATPIGKVKPIGENEPVRSDTEGLAFSPNGMLWAVDEESGRLFAINQKTGLVMTPDVALSGLDYLRGNDFGMTFACDGGLFVSSVAAQTLYVLALNGTLAKVGGAGKLGVRISALAAWGNPTRLYGLGNGLLADGSRDNRSLYRIDTNTGVATLIGPLGAQAADYYEAGLSFDNEGNLWALTDRGDKGNQILKIDINTGNATLVSTTQVSGFESLAIAPPGDCTADPIDDSDLPALSALDGRGTLIALFAFLVTGLLAAGRRIG